MLNNTVQRALPSAGDLLFNFFEGYADHHHADLLLLRVIDGRKNAQRFSERAPVDGDILYLPARVLNRHR